MEITKNLETKLENKSWTDTQDPDFINFLRDVQNAIEVLATQVVMYNNVHEQFGIMVEETYILRDVPAEEESQDGYDKPIPTQTSRGAENA